MKENEHDISFATWTNRLEFIQKGQRFNRNLFKQNWDRTSGVTICEIIYNGEILFDDRLTEIDCGDFEAQEETPEMMQSFYQAIQIGDKGTENFKTFMKRNLDLCELITREYKGKNILIVTHAANARVINYYFSGKPKDYDFTKGVAANNEILMFEN